MVTCTEHGCRLEPAADIKWAVLSGLDVPAVPAIAHTLAMDRLTFGGLRTGRVRLPGGSMHIGVWFRLLRTLIDELSTSTATLTVGSRQAVDTIWRVLAAPARAGLTVFRPYEQLDWQHQQILMHAAAVALHLVETGEVTARGTLGHYLARQPHRPVPEGDRRAWQFKQAVAELDAMVIRARTDRDTAHQLMAWYDIGSDRSSSFDRARELMLGLDIPVHYLPDSREALRSRLRELPRQDRSTSTEPSGSGFS